jgi:C4-dicarboxylate transporter/malic acid transport protein
MAHDIETATNGDDTHNGKPLSAELRKIRAKDRISHFTWAWFACTMSTGAIAVVLGQTPYRFKGLDTIGKIFFLLDLILFILFSILISIRFGMRPLVALRSLHHPGEALFFGAFCVSVALIINCIEIYGGPSTGPWLTKALEICFWSYAACAFCVAVFQYATLFVSERLPVSSAMPAWVFPAYPFLVIGPLAGVLLPSQPPEAALPMFVGAVMLQGLGWVISMCMYSIYIQRLMGSELPPPPSRPGMYISVGPVGYTATGLVSLGVQATSVIPADFLLVSSVDVGEVVKILGVLSGMFLVLLAVWFFSLSTVAVLEDVKDMSFTLNWWAFIFPNAGMILALIQIGKVLQNKPIKVITSVMTVALVAMWFFVAVSHVLAVQKKLILWEGKDEDAGMDLDPTSLRKRRRIEREQENER